jgi:MFS family permease
VHTYRDLFHAREYGPFFLVSTAQVVGQTIGGLALGTSMYLATGSPLLAALAMFGPALAQVIGVTTLLSAADRLPPRAALTGLSVLFGAGTAVQALPGLPVWAGFAILLVQGIAASLTGGVRYGLLNEILDRDGYLLGRSALNMAGGVTQIAGFAVGGTLVTTISARGTLLVAAATYLAAAVIARFGLTERKPRATGGASIARTWRTNTTLWSTSARRNVYLALWVPNGFVVGAESLYISYDPAHAGLLFACGAVGMLAGDTAVGRFTPARWRGPLIVPLCLLLAAPYLVFVLHPGLPVAIAAVVLATPGYASGLLLQDRLLDLTPGELSGQALGLQSSGMLALQGVGAALAGAVAELTSPAAGIALMAGTSLAVTAALTPGLRRPVEEPARTSS